MIASDESALLATIVANPQDNTARLVYADWLDEHGRPTRAELIRTQVRLGQVAGADAEYPALLRRERELLNGTRRGEGEFAERKQEIEREFKRHGFRYAKLTFKRGFPVMYIGSGPEARPNVSSFQGLQAAESFLCDWGKKGMQYQLDVKSVEEAEYLRDAPLARYVEGLHVQFTDNNDLEHLQPVPRDMLPVLSGLLLKLPGLKTFGLYFLTAPNPDNIIDANEALDPEYVRRREARDGEVRNVLDRLGTMLPNEAIEDLSLGSSYAGSIRLPRQNMLNFLGQDWKNLRRLGLSTRCDDVALRSIVELPAMRNLVDLNVVGSIRNQSMDFIGTTDLLPNLRKLRVSSMLLMRAPEWLALPNFQRLTSLDLNGSAFIDCQNGPAQQGADGMQHTPVFLGKSSVLSRLEENPALLPELQTYVDCRSNTQKERQISAVLAQRVPHDESVAAAEAASPQTDVREPVFNTAMWRYLGPGPM